MTWWHNLIAFHATVLPVVLWSDAMLRTRAAPLLRVGLSFSLVVALGVVFAMATAAPQFRRGGRDAMDLVLGTDHEIVHDLWLDECCAVRIDPITGAWPRKNNYFYQLYVQPYKIPPPTEPPGPMQWD